MLDLQHLGDRIREIRKRKMMTIKVLAEYTGLSSGYLSMLEQNKTNPTIDNLARICDALDISINTILNARTEEKTVIRRDEMTVEEHLDENMSIGIVDFGYDNYIYEYITIEPGKPKKQEPYRHICDEVCTVMSGQLSVELDGEVYRLLQGDSLYIKGGRQHRIYNETQEKTVSFWIYQRRQAKLF